RAVSGGSTAEFSVLDADGKQVCDVWPSLSTWTTCALAPGVAHTVLVTGRDTAAEYTLARRDVTATARGCAANPATAVGGPSTGGTPAAPGLLLCRQVTTADAGDTLHLDVRDPLGTANILVYDAEGDAVCSYRNKACAVTGSTSYQVLVTVPANLKAAASYRFDALRIATPAGPAAECAKAPNVSYGYGPVTGTLDEQHSAVCAALPTAYSDRFDFVAGDTAGGTQTAVPALYDASLDNTCTQYIPTGYKCSVNEPYTTGVTPSILVVGLPEKASQTAYRAELVCTSSLCGTEKITVGTVTPAGGVSGARTTVTVTGTALHEDDKVRISKSGRTVESTTTSVATDRKSLTAVLDLTGLTPGDWNLSVITHNGWEYPRGSFTVSPAPLKNTTAPAVTGTARVGSRLTAAPGSWTPAPDSYTYQWKADGQVISGATAATYLVPASLRGKKVTVAVTARKSGWQSTTAESSARVITAAPRDHAGTGSVPDGVGDLLTLNSSGSLTFHHGSGTGVFSGKTSGSGWPASVRAIPFGDVNGDRCNDVLVRMADGSLRAYRPGCGKAVTPSTSYVSLGTGWNQYDVLTSPGDITGDGRADLITRSSSTGAVYLHKGTSD
ncbi:FG-GAP-like repeat-containing protein, partial [Streptomyces sp. NPDC006129]|uniref:FG-GAP-like repeat-containing protein n=1 Tax=Streptomyces sp. NPDC006129 TaxID=3155348 RepID=UPI0033BE8E95